MQKKIEDLPQLRNLCILAENFEKVMTTPIQKKRLVTSIHNLSPELQEAVKAFYPLGFSEAMIRIDKPNGDFFYAVPYETDEVAYLVKIDVKIDDVVDDEDDKDYFDDDLKGADEIQDEAMHGDEPSDDDIDI